MTNKDAMNEAIKEAYEGIKAHDGGPFGTVILKDGVIIGRGHNRVIKNQDPTCHGEMEAIRDACKNLKTFDLTGCTLYTTSQPCPMCLGAIMWSNIKHVFQGCNIHDAEDIGFRDNAFYEYLNGKSDLLTIKEESRAECLKLFSDYKEDSENQAY